MNIYGVLAICSRCHTRRTLIQSIVAPVITSSTSLFSGGDRLENSGGRWRRLGRSLCRA